MRKIILMFCAAILLVAGVSGCGKDDSPLQAIRDRGVLRVGIKVDVPGFGYLNPDTKKYEGLEIDLAKMIAKEILGNAEAVELIGVTAQMRGPLLDNGEVDIVIATFTITDERKQLFNFTEPYFYDEIGFLVKKDSGLQSIADMDGATVGIAISATTYDALVAEGEKIGIEMNYQRYSSYPELQAALLSGDIDAFAVDKSILFGYVDDETMIMKEGFNPQDYGIASKLDNQQLADFLDEFIKNIKKDGRLAEILTRWGQEMPMK